MTETEEGDRLAQVTSQVSPLQLMDREISIIDLPGSGTGHLSSLYIDHRHAPVCKLHLDKFLSTFEVHGGKPLLKKMRQKQQIAT